ncbi:uncharacterized protein IAS62_004122 [Cryptococcus decagattii]|uniref:Uncharacterized protein n=1 Tax=Cryptococcus decagattii TaxID=1859122 RepID=A0ABZ2AY30_9TREE
MFQDHPLFSPGAMQEEQDVISRGVANSTGTHTHDKISPLIQLSPLITFNINSIALFAPQCSASPVEHLHIAARTDGDLLQDGKANAVTESVVSVFGTASTSTDPYSDRIGNDGRAYLQDLSILNATDSSAGEFRSTVQDLVRRQLKGQWRILRKNVHEERSGLRMSRYEPVMEGNVEEVQTVQSMDDRMPNQIWESTLSHTGPYSQIGSGMTDEPPPPYRSQKGSEDSSQSSSIYSQQRLQSQYESYQSHHRRLHPQQCMSHQITPL